MNPSEREAPPEVEEEEEKFCPKIEASNNNMQQLTYEERLSIVENEVQSLYKFCLEKKFTNGEIQNCLANLYGPPKSLTRKALDDTASSFFFLSAIVAFVAVLLSQPKVYNLAVVHGRLFSMEFILPHWDWASLYNEDCIINNQWLPEVQENVTADDCMYCNKTEVGRIADANHSFIMEECVENGKPIVVTDTRKDWNGKQLTMDEIIYIYQHHKLLATTLGSCLFHNNADFNDMFYDFFQAYADKKLPADWYATWINCDPKAAKVIRHYYTRPYFLPGNMQLGGENIVITASGIHSNESYTVPQSTLERDGLWVTVLSGSLQFILSPMTQCSEQFGCTEVTVDVLAGETLFIAQETWTALCRPNDVGITIAVASPVNWDKS